MAKERTEPDGSHEPRHWRGGLLDFYVNAGDPRLWVPKRRGWGWTLNLAHPRARLVIAALVAAVAAAALLSNRLRAA